MFKSQNPRISFEEGTSKTISFHPTAMGRDTSHQAPLHSYTWQLIRMGVLLTPEKPKLPAPNTASAEHILKIINFGWDETIPKSW